MTIAGLVTLKVNVVLQFMNPKMMVKKGGKCPPGNINSWFFEASGLKEHVLKKLPKQVASKINFEQTTFGRYPENLLISRRRFNHAYAVRISITALIALQLESWSVPGQLLS